MSDIFNTEDLGRCRSVTEAMTDLGIGRTKLYEEIGEGRLRAYKIGRKTIIYERHLRAYKQSLPIWQPATGGGQ
jgi:excisionase family DNA binding protein